VALAEIDRGTNHPKPVELDAGDLTELIQRFDLDARAAATPDELVRAAARAGRLLPEATHDALCHFVDDVPLAGAMVVHGLPVGRVPETPGNPRDVTGKDLVSELVLLTVARRLGQPVGYAPEHGGGLVQNLVPTPGDVGRQTSTSSGVRLGFHTETAFHPHRPRYLLLLCLRGDPAGLTLLCSVPHALATLAPDAQVVLRQPRFDTGVDESFGCSDRRSEPFAVVAGDPDEPVVTFDAELTRGLDADAESALALLRDAIEARYCAVMLDEGDLLVVDNAIVVHGRSEFPARFDGTDRWLQRAFVVPDLSASSGERVGRVITTTF
jgi:L-asparagine oxygenase